MTALIRALSTAAYMHVRDVHDIKFNPYLAGFIKQTYKIVNYIGAFRSPSYPSGLSVLLFPWKYSLYEMFAIFTVTANKWNIHAEKMEFILEICRKS